jgi:hypothetical protein
MSSSPTYVSAFYNIYDGLKDIYLDYFTKFLEQGFPTILFLDKNLTDWLDRLSSYSNLTILSQHTFQDLPLAKLFAESDTKLPESRNLTKDTYGYLILMNSKIQFVYDAIQVAKTDNLAWIDFGMMKLIKNPMAVFSKLSSVTIPEDRILMPGCTPQSKVNYNNVHWRFCGSLFFGNKATIARFHNLNNTYLESLKSQKILTWEVNVWALIEHTDPTIYKWYKGDHNDEIVNFPILGERRVIVTLMIKNEERIIKRCITNALSIADAFCISDTGSTDDTVKILEEFLPSLAVRAKLVQHPWHNFGHNRTQAFQASQTFCNELGWNPETTYALLIDADMNFVMTPEYDKDAMIATGYRIKQKTSNLEYYNTRLVKIGHPWRCVGVTHEYWDGAECMPLDTIYIKDIGDGGCKNDKFERDERLLKKGLEDEPKNERYMFYLAQTLKDLKRLPEAIDMYKRRINAGGWYEEIWYSMYVISKLYYELGNLTEMEYWGLKAYDLNKNRSENIYFLTKIFREKQQYHKSWHYLQIGLAIKKPNELLFLESDVYNHLFKYEKTILNYYIQPHKQTDSMRDIIDYLNHHGGPTYSNLKYYVQQLKTKKITTLSFPDYDDFIATSTSILKIYNTESNDSEAKYRLNIRYVNYRIQPDGSYLMVLDGNASRDNPVRTRNFTCLVNSEFSPVSPLTEMITSFPPKRSVHIEGLEDLRIYYDSDGLIKWSGTSMEYSHDGKIRQIMGTYNTVEHTLINPVSMKPPKETDCEKNWIPLGDNMFIYCWYPYTIGKIEGDTFVIKLTQNLPRYFEHMRGSSNVVEYKGSLWTLTHSVMYSTPRKYYHQLIRLNKDTKKVETYTYPFYFKTNHIEYCLGIELKNETLYAIVSQNDANPFLIEAPLIDLRMYGV